MTSNIIKESRAIPNANANLDRTTYREGKEDT
jgi:hypothetical protein